MLTMKEILLYAVTAGFSFIVIALNMMSALMAGSDLGTDVLLAFGFIYEWFLLIMLILKSGLVRKEYNAGHIRFARKLLGAAETVYVVIMLHILLSLPRVLVFFYNAANEPLRALKNALFFPWLYDYYITKLGYTEPHNMAFAWILPGAVATTVLIYIAISRFHTAKKLAAFLEYRPKKQQENVFKRETDFEEAASKEKQPKLLEEPADDELIPDEEEFQRHLRQIALLSRNCDPIQLWECPHCGSLNPDGSGRCEFCGADRENKAFSEPRKEENDD
ncbi:MAG: zinc ribbon domain-containing protein [Oscillospiraceae bacterium]|nr:zinc ribbon domain-containing protein [Oscillospiraceae bacterium]